MFYSGFELGGKSVLSDRLHSDNIKSILPPRDTLYLPSHVCTKIQNIGFYISINRQQACPISSRLNTPQSSIFQSCRDMPTLPGFNQFCRELMCFAQGHNMVPPVGFDS